MISDPRRSRLALVATVVALFVGACVSGVPLADHASYIQEHATRTHDAALRCDAEREIALAESHLEFLLYEMERGKFSPAVHHMEIARENIDAVRAIVDDRPECFGIVIVTDSDADGIPDESDNCPMTPNPDQSDIDRDGQGDVCDDDMDGDGILNDPDNCPMTPNPDQADTDSDGVGDACSNDRDGDGYADDVDECPRDPEDFDGFEDEDGCPERDNDRDGLPDPTDNCPTDPEDIDGFEDEDGCPDVDNDSDGIVDVDDACPIDPEDFDGDRDDDGCPDESSLVIVTDTQIEITQQINFETGSATITGAISFEILDEVSTILIRNPDMALRIEGHTDSQGSASYNLRLSQDRADSVRAYLIGQGVDPGRLEAVGFGEETPIADNATEDGRAANRRVEFHITSR